MGFEVEALHHSPAALALETAHDVAFQKGLGSTHLALTNKYLTNKSITAYASKVYSKGNVAVVASGAPQSALEKWTSEFFGEVPSGASLPTIPTKYYGGQNRIYSTRGDALVIAFPGSSGFPSFAAEYSVLSCLLGGETAVKWNAGLSALSRAVSDIPNTTAVAQHIAYSDAGLLYIAITGPASELTGAGKKAVEAFKSLATVKPEDLKKAIALAKFNALAAAEDRTAGLEAVGQSVIANGKVPLVGDTVKAIEAVTAVTIKTVCFFYSYQLSPFSLPQNLHTQQPNAIRYRLSKSSWKERLHLLPLANYISCHTRKNWV
jgi:ubiquinol-cytochrome c reductase core subunit 2